MMLNYVKYGLSEDPDPKSQIGIIKNPVEEKIILKSRQPSTINTNVIEDTQEKKIYKKEYVWWNIILLGTLHIAAVYGLCLKFDHFGANVFGTYNKTTYIY